jgi:hypothetical protein
MNIVLIPSVQFQYYIHIYRQVSRVVLSQKGTNYEVLQIVYNTLNLCSSLGVRDYASVPTTGNKIVLYLLLRCLE